jgi:uncharacterized protein (UPF0548 family)
LTVVEWRLGSSWPAARLAADLERARALPRNFDPAAPLTADRGWNIVHSRAAIAREPAGPPLPRGPFQRTWHGIEHFLHSDPRIVVAHFRNDLPLVGRPVLLELKPAALRYLCPAVIADRRDTSGTNSTCRGFSLETLEGHLERGREWFLLEKDHATGWVYFRIEAAWLPGEFPNWWSRHGFHLLGRRYQRAWHRLAHLRLRRVAAGLSPGEPAGPDHVEHEGPPIPTEPVQFFAQRGVGRLGVDVEEEVEEMSSDAFWRAAGLGALSGVRSLGPAAIVARESARRRRRLRRRKPGRALALLAAGEMLADKLPFTPPRTRAPALLARLATGGWAGSRAVRGGRARLVAGALGATAAVAATHLVYRLRRRAASHSRWTGLATALAEDSLVVWAGRRLAASAPS